MITAPQSVSDMILSPVRKITAKVEVYSASTLVDTFSYDDNLENISIERCSEEGKFFGFGICQRLVVKLRDLDREIDYITPQHTLKVYFGANNQYICTAPTFHITQSRRDENTNELKIYAYDLIYGAAAHYVSELAISAPYSPNDLAVVCAQLLGASGISIQRLSPSEQCFSKVYASGANFEGTESIREALNDIAEATQTIYYVDANNKIVFKRLDKDCDDDFALSKANYISLTSSDSRRLATICHATELGDNISASTVASGSTQYVRDNAFWTALDGTETAAMVNAALAAVGGLTINQFDCSWRGNFLLDIGDKIALTTKDDSTVTTFVLDDTIEYDGAFKETTKFTYKPDDTETSSNSSNLGDALKQTFAKVDKAEKNVEIVVADVKKYDSRIAALEFDTGSISASVTQTQNNMNDNVDALNASITEITKKLESTITPDEVSIKIQQSIDSGAKKVETETGFTFDENGLSIVKEGAELSTQITEDGMVVNREGEAVLTANNQGVDAVNLHAKTYLIVGKYSRFEDYGQRTGCFWIG